MESASLKLSERLAVPVGPGRMWSFITDPESVVTCMPGAAITGERDDGTLEGSLLTKLGPTTVTFRGTVLLDFDHEHHAGTLTARGGDARGRTKAAATVAFRLSGDEQVPSSELQLEATVDVSGGLAPFVRSGGAHLMRRMLADFSANLGALGLGDDTAQAPSDGGVTGAGSAVSRSAPSAEPIHGFGLIVSTLADMLRGALRRLWKWLSKRPSRSVRTDERGAR